MVDEGIQRRAQRRIEAALPIHVRGVDGQGQEFEETAEALEISRRGLSFSTQRELPVYTSLMVVIPGRGPIQPGEGPTDFFATASVVRVVKEGETSRVSLRFIGATLNVYSSENL